MKQSKNMNCLLERRILSKILLRGKIWNSISNVSQLVLKLLLLESSFLLNWSRRPPGRYQRYGVHLLKKDQQNSTVEIQEVVNMTIGWSFSLYCNCTVVIVTDNDGSVTQLVGYPMGHKLGHKYLIRVLENSWNIQPSFGLVGNRRADSLIPNFQVPDRASLSCCGQCFGVMS